MIVRKESTVTEVKSRLARRLTLNDAILLGLGSMIGAGIFSAAGPAVQAAGNGLLIAILLAAIAAYLNATTMAQLAALYPESGGTYVYGRRRLGDFMGFLAGWGFIIGKIASCTAMALTFGYYTYPEYAHAIALVSIIGITFVNYFGVKKTVRVTKLLVAFVLICLSLIVIAVLSSENLEYYRLGSGFLRGGVKGVLEAAGLMFFAFAGYARVATLGEEVLDPQENIPKAILVALGITVVIYFIVIGTTLLAIPIEEYIRSKAPLAQAVENTHWHFLAPLVKLGAVVASLSVLLSLVAGISRTVFAMSTNRDLPIFLSAVHPVHKIPHRAELLVGTVIAVVVSFVDLRSAIGFSSFAILTYYAIANLSALSLQKSERRFPKIFSICGFVICILLAFSLPIKSIYGGIILFAIGSLIFFYRKTQRLKN